ncbi:MAG: hypothetical protein WC974_04745 [Thermoplasmata archaeon]
MDKEIETILKLIGTERRLGVVLMIVGALQVIVGIFTLSRYFAIDEFWRAAFDRELLLGFTDSLLLIFGLLLAGIGFSMYTGELKMKQHVSLQYPQQANPPQSMVCPPQQQYPLGQQYPPQNPSPPPPL